MLAGVLVLTVLAMPGVGPSLVSLVLMVLPWWLSLTFPVSVAEVALSVMPLARPLRALLRFTASLIVLTLLVVGVGPCVGGQWLVSGSRSLVMPFVRVLQAMSGVMSSVRLVLVVPLVWVPLVTVWLMGSCAMLWWRGCCY